MSSGTPLIIDGGLRLDWGDGSPPSEGARWEEHTYAEGEFHARVRFEKLPPATISLCNIGGEALVGISQWGDPEHLGQPMTLLPKIGRASCREREEVAVGDDGVRGQRQNSR